MRLISKHFTDREARCRCGECDKFSADIELVRFLEQLRYNIQSIYGEGILPVTDERRIFINSWFRCRAHNNRPKDQKNAYGQYGAGSNDNSWHPLGAGVDYRAEGVPHYLLYKIVRKMKPSSFGVGLYDWGIHTDIRTNRADWDNRTAEAA